MPVAQNNRTLDYWFILAWLVLNLLQAYATELTSDEGYYWFYSTQLEWGYYDHPPFLALLIKLGYGLFPSEFGVRLIGILLQGLSLTFFFKLFPQEQIDKKVVYLIFLSIPLLSYVTFIVFPDTPLLSFLIFYLYGYKRLLEKGDGQAALIIGVALAMMLYSKYHAVLVVFFTLISNLKLLRNKRFIQALFLAFVLFLPHLLWQYWNDFPSFKYHLQGRSAASISTKHLGGYLGQQLGAIGPVLCVIPFLFRPKGQFEYTLKVIVIGTLTFFTLASFRGMVHFHWTSIILFPLIIIASLYFQRNNKQKLFYYGVFPFLVLTMILRLHLAVKIFPVNNFNVDYYHGRPLWAADIAQLSEGSPVLFENNLREAPLYSFYSGNEGVALYPEDWKKSQYELWGYEDRLQGKPVLLVKPRPFSHSTAFDTRMENTIHYVKVPDFVSFENIELELQKDVIQQEDSIKFPLQIINHRDKRLAFKVDQFGQLPKLYCRLTKGKQRKVFYKNIETEIDAHSNQLSTISIPRDSMFEGSFIFSFGFDDGILFPSENSPFYQAEDYQIFSSTR